MAIQQFRKVKLVDPKNAVYLSFCTDRALERKTLRPKSPPTAINQLSLLFEDVMRNLLAEYFTLTSNRILAFEERNQFGYIQKYREIDAISLERSQPNLLFEIKTSSNPNPQRIISKAKKQLEASKKIASFLNKDLKLCIIYIDISSVQIPLPSELSSSDINFFDNLDSLQKNMLLEISGIILSGTEIWQQAIQRGLTNNSALWTEAQQEIEENTDKRKQREALIAQGISSDEFPEFLQPKKIETIPMLQFGEFRGGSSLQQAFLKAQQKQKC